MLNNLLKRLEYIENDLSSEETEEEACIRFLYLVDEINNLCRENGYLLQTEKYKIITGRCSDIKNRMILNNLELKYNFNLPNIYLVL